MKRWTLPRLLEPKSITFGFTVFYFVWTAAAWLGAPFPSYSHFGGPDYHFNLFMAALLFVAAAGLVINRTWGKLLATTLCGQVPLAFCFLFWMSAQQADALSFSPAHITQWLRELTLMPIEAWLWLAVSSIILSYAAPAIVRAKRVDKSALMPAGRAVLPPHTQLAREQLRHFTTPATSAGLRAHHHASVR